jgi:hypothetical protein
MEQSAAVRATEFYRSPNGDRWLLARGPETSRVLVRHEPNPPSGGQVVDIEIELSHCSRQRTGEARTPAPDWNSGLEVPRGPTMF